MSRLLAVLLVLATPARAEEPAPREVYEVLDGYVRTLDGGTVQVHGGAWLPSDTLQDTAKELASLRAENAALKDAPAPKATSASVLVVALVVGVLLGGGAAALVLKK